jgi:hypothetical protein
MISKNTLISKDTPILITSAIISSAPLTRLEDINQRVSFLAGSLRLWAASGVSQIVVCDGSTTEIASVLSKAIDLHSFSCRIEILGFVNSIEKVKRLGKGYGEGEIVKYAISHSHILSESAYFVKCTGKLFVVNYWNVIKGFRGEFGASSKGFAFLPQIVDTRFYITSKEFFLRKMANSYLSVNDQSGIYLENVYFAVLYNSPDTHWYLATPPIYVGVSGSSGLANSRDYLYPARFLFARLFSLAFSLKQHLKASNQFYVLRRFWQRHL